PLSRVGASAPPKRQHDDLASGHAGREGAANGADDEREEHALSKQIRRDPEGGRDLAERPKICRPGRYAVDRQGQEASEQAADERDDERLDEECQENAPTAEAEHLEDGDLACPM